MWHVHSAAFLLCRNIPRIVWVWVKEMHHNLCSLHQCCTALTHRLKGSMLGNKKLAAKSAAAWEQQTCLRLPGVALCFVYDRLMFGSTQAKQTKHTRVILYDKPWDHLVLFEYSKVAEDYNTSVSLTDNAHNSNSFVTLHYSAFHSV